MKSTGDKNIYSQVEHVNLLVLVYNHCMQGI